MKKFWLIKFMVDGQRHFATGVYQSGAAAICAVLNQHPQAHFVSAKRIVK